MAKAILLRLLKMVGFKTLIRLSWKHVVYPQLKSWVETNDIPDWDEKLLDKVNDAVIKAIELF